MSDRNKTFCLAVALVLPLLLSSCVSPENSQSELEKIRIDQCKSGDIEVAGTNQCLQDDAACYAISSGLYCTGTRASTCPDGSVALSAGASCPDGRRCFQLSESQQCLADQGLVKQ